MDLKQVDDAKLQQWRKRLEERQVHIEWDVHRQEVDSDGKNEILGMWIPICDHRHERNRQMRGSCVQLARRHLASCAKRLSLLETITWRRYVRRGGNEKEGSRHDHQRLDRERTRHVQDSVVC